MACAAGIAVLDVIKSEKLMKNAIEIEDYFKEQVSKIPQVKTLKGKGLMAGVEFDFEVSELRKKLIYEHQIFTGGAMNKNLLRILPPLSVTKANIDTFINALKSLL